jgi:hypothetical protein
MSPDAQFAAFLVSALLTAEALLVAVFGSLYSVYGAYMTTGAAPICRLLRWLCGLMTLIIVIAAALGAYSVNLLATAAPQIPTIIFLGLGVIVVLIPTPAVLITWRMYKDAAS